MYILFENPGGFIKKGSAILMFLELIGAVITYFYLISVDEGLAFLILLLPVAFFFIIFINMFFYGFGVLVENSGSSAYSDYESRRRIDQIYSQLGNGDSKKVPRASKSARVLGNLYKDDDEPQKIASTADAGCWICTCGKVHPKYVSSCECGTSKVNGKLKK